VDALSITGFSRLRALATRYNDQPHAASRPFDAARDGFVMGEGGGAVVIEAYEHALARGARIYAEVCVCTMLVIVRRTLSEMCFISLSRGLKATCWGFLRGHACRTQRASCMHACVQEACYFMQYDGTWSGRV
jgi:hypothetical protein